MSEQQSKVPPFRAWVAFSPEGRPAYGTCAVDREGCLSNLAGRYNYSHDPTEGVASRLLQDGYRIVEVLITQLGEGPTVTIPWVEYNEMCRLIREAHDEGYRAAVKKHGIKIAGVTAPDVDEEVEIRSLREVEVREVEKE